MSVPELTGGRIAAVTASGAIALRPDVRPLLAGVRRGRDAVAVVAPASEGVLTRAGADTAVGVGFWTSEADCAKSMRWWRDGNLDWIE
jgi:hypothetical protein